MLIALTPSLLNEICKHKGMDKAVAFFSAFDVFTLKKFMEETGLTRGVAQLILKDLVWTEHLEKKGRKYYCGEKLKDGNIIINVRDIRSEVLFKRKGMRDLLYWLGRGRKQLSDIAIEAGASISTVKRSLRELRKSRIVSGFMIDPKVLWVSPDPLDIVPRREHALILRNFISLAESQGSIDCPLIFFGDASWGKSSLTLKVMALFKIGPGIDGHVEVMERLVLASKTITSTYGVSIDLTFSATEAWLTQKLKMTTTKNFTLNEAFEGICIHGVLPKEEEYFELLRQTVPFPREKIESWLAKRYISVAKNKYTLTEKGVKMLRQRAPSKLIEGHIPIFDREIPFISIKPAHHSI